METYIKVTRNEIDPKNEIPTFFSTHLDTGIPWNWENGNFKHTDTHKYGVCSCYSKTHIWDIVEFKNQESILSDR